jgi:predicted SAM-dependent methyltransferase
MKRFISKLTRQEYYLRKIYHRLFVWKQKKLRKKIVNTYLEQHEVKKLQIGCGHNVIETWLNSDILPRYQSVAYIDASEVFPLESSSFDYVYSEHVFEHLKFNIANNYLKESFRILKKGGKVRIAMPNIHFLMEIMKNPELDLHKRYITRTINHVLPEVKEQFKNKPPEQLATFVVNNFFRDWEHEIIYDFKTISLMLEHHGFSEIKQANIGESNDTHLKNMERHGTIISPEFNELETMVIQAVK